MKKFAKFVMGAAAIAGTVCGAVYLMKKVFGIDVLDKNDDDFDDDFDDISDDEDDGDREYVTLDMDEEENNGEEEQEETETPGTPDVETEAE